MANCRSLAGVLVLRTALERFRPSAETITPLHAMLALLCLLSRMHSVMLPILAEDITRISPAETATDAEDVLLYLYYGGTVYLGLRRFREAEDMFASAISGMCGSEYWSQSLAFRMRIRRSRRRYHAWLSTVPETVFIEQHLCMSCRMVRCP
jgi:hypothetical protein